MDLAKLSEVLIYQAHYDNPCLMETTLRKFITLFNFSFSEFLTLKLIRILYALAICGMGILSFAIVINAFELNTLAGIGAMVVAPVVFFLGVTFARVFVELVILLFRIAEHTRVIAESTRPKK